MIDAREQEVHGTLLSQGFTRDRSYSRGYRYVGLLSVHRRSIGVALEFSDLEFIRPPKLILLKSETDCPEVVAHLTGDGEFCYVRREQVVLDRYTAGSAMLRCLQTIHESLDRAITHKDPSAEIAQEFPQHWLAPLIGAIDFRSSESGQAWIYEVPRPSHPLLFLTDSPESLRSFGISPQDQKRMAQNRRPAFVCRTSHTLTFPPGTRQPTTLSEFLDWAERIESGLAERLWRAAVAPFPDVAALFVYGPNGCVGITYSVSSAIVKKNRQQGILKFLQAHADTYPVVRIICQRVDADFVFSRNEDRQPPLADKSIVLVGCGTIGSHLARFLVQSGAGSGKGSVVLVDMETLSAGNVGRHLLGLLHYGENKARALKDELDRSFPGSRTIAHASDALRLLPIFDGADLIIDATGEEALSRSINHYFVSRRRTKKSPAVLHVWLVGHGDAAQAVMVESPEYACYKCLRDHIGDWRFWPLLPEHRPQLVLGPCGDGMFMPYGVGSPAIAAGLGLQMAIEWSAGDAKPYFRTICINPRTTRAVRNHNAKKLDGCLACGAVQSASARESSDPESSLLTL